MSPIKHFLSVLPVFQKRISILTQISILVLGLLSPQLSWSEEVSTVAAPASMGSTSSVTEYDAEWKNVLPPHVQLRYGSVLSQVYLNNHMQQLWLDQQARKNFQQQLAEMALAGVHPQFELWVSTLADTQLQDKARDILLSDALLGYISFVSDVPENGRRWLYGLGKVNLTPPTEEQLQRWQQAIQQNTLPEYIASLAPQHPQYFKMHAALLSIVTSESDTRPWPKITESASLRMGGVSEHIAELREILSRTGVLGTSSSQSSETELSVAPTLNKGGVSDDSNDEDMLTELEDKKTVATTQVPQVKASQEDKRYTAELAEGVKRFQERHGLQPDGVIGTRTRDWLNVSPQMRARLLALNIQRLRLLPVDVADGIMVNIPDYSLIYYKGGAEALASRVIVGSPSRKTPLMDSSLNNVVINPPWSVPVKLIREDIVPKVKRDPSYLQRLNYTLYSGWGSDSVPIDPSTIDWSNVSAGSFPYRIQQAPGSNNSLGRFKFNMPNTEAIYLHDTPNHGLFAKDIRALSSGCVRVNKAAELANLLLKDVGWDTARVATTLERGHTTHVSVKQKIPVELYYLTAWIGENGVPQYRTDIYRYDALAQSAAQIPEQVKALFL